MGGTIAALLARSAMSKPPQGALTLGAPADFSGPVIPNPDNLEPSLDTDPPQATKLASARFAGKTYRGKVKMDVSSPDRAQLLEPELKEF